MGVGTSAYWNILLAPDFVEYRLVFSGSPHKIGTAS